MWCAFKSDVLDIGELSRQFSGARAKVVYLHELTSQKMSLANLGAGSTFELGSAQPFVSCSAWHERLPQWS